MKTMKTCKIGCGKMKSGGSVVKKVKKMATGGQMYGIPQTGPTGPNYQGIDTMKKGGMIKKYQKGGSNPPLASTTPGEISIGMMKKGGAKKMAKGGATSFGMLSVKAGVDKNPKATAADRIAGAKMSKKKMGGSIRKKK